jgi:hypothetical protein
MGVMAGAFAAFFFDVFADFFVAMSVDRFDRNGRNAPRAENHSVNGPSSRGKPERRKMKVPVE